MYFYKHLDENGNTVTLESRNVQAVNAPETMVEITETEYQTLLEEMMANIEPEPTDQISAAEALEIITGGVTE